MNKKKLLPLCILAGVVVVLALILAMLTLFGGDAEEEAGIPLFSVSADALDTIAYQDGDTDVALTKGDDGVWTLDSDTLLPIDQTVVEELTANVTGMTALRELGDDADVDSMGFATPEMSISFTSGSDSYTLTVDNDAIVYTVQDWYGIYDGTPHGITVNVTTPADGATVTYKTTEDGNYSDQKPTYTNAGNYTVYFKIEAKGYDAVTGSAKVIIEKAQLTEATVTGGPYTGQQVGSVSEVNFLGVMVKVSGTVPTKLLSVLAVMIATAVPASTLFT